MPSGMMTSGFSADSLNTLSVSFAAHPLDLNTPDKQFVPCIKQTKLIYYDSQDHIFFVYRGFIGRL